MKKLNSSLRTLIITAIAAVVLAVPVFAQDATPEATTAGNGLPNIVLVHGAWADGSSWTNVIKPLQAAGYNVTAPQFPLTTQTDNVDRLRQVLNYQTGPTLIVGHSYGGQIMTALGKDAPNVVGIVYIAAFGLDAGESIGGLLDLKNPTPALAHLRIDENGFAYLSEDDFVHHFAADVDPVDAEVMFATQKPAAIASLGEQITDPAWKYFPTWYMVATNDETIPPDAERLFAKRMGATTVEVASSHVPMVSHPADVVALIEEAVKATSK